MKKYLYLLFVFIQFANVIYAQISPVTADANTVILDHFDNSVIGEARGCALSYSDSQNGLSNAIDFSGGGSYVMYAETVNLSAQGTVEMWIKLSSYNKGLLNINWFNSSSYPSSGHVFHLRIDDSGKVSLGGWGNPSNSFTGNSVVSLNKWTHIAVSWGDSTKIYINGKVDLVSSLWFRPAVYMSTNYIYLPYWGESCGYIDELHISSVQRTNAEIASRVADHTQQPVETEVKLHQALVSGGGTLTGNNGSCTYSVGQTVFHHFSSNAGSISEGVQQPVEISFTGFNQVELKTETAVYPNPADDYLILKIKEDVLKEKLFYEFCDLNGRILKKDKIRDIETKIDLKTLLPSCYLLKIVNDNNQSKTYKIIKK